MTAKFPEVQAQMDRKTRKKQSALFINLGWTKDDDIILFRRLKFVLPADDDLAFSKRADCVNWNDVSCKL